MLILVLFLSLNGYALQNEAIDKEISQLIDVTGDGINDKVILQIKAKSWDMPFKWTLAAA